jgi:hypothetical protein
MPKVALLAPVVHSSVASLTSALIRLVMVQIPASTTA